ncbi:MAG TPA: flippase-like domain-containing protein [Gammaproteobacteria bacterium]|nr:flippase-like domain-containing protein [Gammaproteobacteria bacterium]
MLLRFAVYLAWTAGLALFACVIVYQGFGDIMTVLASAGWGLAIVTGFHLAPLVVDALGWRELLTASQRRSITQLAWIRWIGESANSLLPVAQVGGELLRVRLLNRAGVSGAMAGASVIVDITAGMLTLIVFALMGIILLLAEGGATEAVAELTIGIMIFSTLGLISLLAQRAGIFLAFARLVERTAKGREWRVLTGGAAALDQTVIRLYRRRCAVFISCGWRLLGWLLGAGEVWLALYFLGHPVGLREALILESLTQALRSAAFAIPGALGVQETSFIVLGGMLGVGADTALALSLMKRVRELVLGVPGLVAWQITEGRHAWRQQMSES